MARRSHAWLSHCCELDHFPGLRCPSSGGEAPSPPKAGVRAPQGKGHTQRAQETDAIATHGLHASRGKAGGAGARPGGRNIRSSGGLGSRSPGTRQGLSLTRLCAPWSAPTTEQLPQPLPARVQRSSRSPRKGRVPATPRPLPQGSHPGPGARPRPPCGPRLSTRRVPQSLPSVGRGGVGVGPQRRCSRRLRISAGPGVAQPCSQGPGPGPAAGHPRRTPGAASAPAPRVPNALGHETSPLSEDP